MDDIVIDTSEDVLSQLESNDGVAYAEIGGVARRITDAVVTGDGVRSANDINETGIWWRLFADGTADYRYTTSLEESHIEDLIDRSIRSAKMLDQSAPAQYDWGTIHRATHPGWSTGAWSLRDVSADEKAERVQTAFADALADHSPEQARSQYRDEYIETTVQTTTGTAVHSTLERASVDTVLVPSSGPKVRQHDGTTTGGAFLDSLPDRFEELASRGRNVSGVDRTTLDGSSTADVVLGPLAAGALFHQLSHYLEIDSVYFGSSPFGVGDRIGPATLSIEDTVHAGSWAARAYDGEGRPTQTASLVSDGVVTNHLYDVPTAIEENAFPSGNMIPSLGFNNPPRIHARHVDVAPGNATDSELCKGADLYITQLGTPRIQNKATRTKRRSTMPSSVLYAKDIETMTPSDFDTESTEQEIHFPINEGYTLREGKRTSLLAEGTIAFSLTDLREVTALGTSRETLTGTCMKHKSMLPFAVTAPAIRLFTMIRIP